jgi:thiol-disulfide isomerase/thioredoxin
MRGVFSAAVVLFSFSAFAIPLGAPKKEWDAHHKKFFTLLEAKKPVSGTAFDSNLPGITVVVAMNTFCPLTRKYVPRLNSFAKDYLGKGVRVVGIFPGADDTAEKIAKFAKDRELDFPAYSDSGDLREHLAMKRVPEVFVLDAKQGLIYRGKIDDQYRVDGTLSAPRAEFLKDVLTSLIDDKPLTHSVTLPQGCLIQTKSQKRTLDFTTDIGPLIHNNCTYCHRPGEIAGYFPLTTYEEITSVFDTVEERVTERLMPPWRADHRYGSFSNNMSFDVQQIHALSEWKKDGFAHGAGKLEYKGPTTSRGWRMGVPDAVIESIGPDSSFTDTKGYAVPESGTVPYQHFRVKTKFPEDKWVTSVEVRPSAPEVVHHVNVFVVQPYQPGDEIVDNPTSFNIAAMIARRRYGITKEELKWTFKLYGQKMNRRLHLIGNFNPMMTIKSYPDGHGFFLPKDAELIFECHYTPNGKATFDNSAIGLRFAKEVPKGNDRKEVYTRAAAQMAAIQIPPHSKQELTSVVPFFAPVRLVSLRPHMHNRGESATAVIEYKDGRREQILHIPKWDYEWQNNYELDPPLELQRGDKLYVTYRWDNTTANPKNPDPEQEVKYGLQFDSEMALAYPTYVYKNVDDAIEAEGELDDFLVRGDLPADVKVKGYGDDKPKE